MAGIHLLLTREVQTAKASDHSDGGGLTLRVGPGGGAKWVLRYTAPTGKRRERGLGVVHRGNAAQAGQSLTTARAAADKARLQLQAGRDPIEETKRQRASARAQVGETKQHQKRQQLTLARAARDYHGRVIEPRLSAKHAAQWIARLENHVPAQLWNRRLLDSSTRPTANG